MATTTKTDATADVAASDAPMAKSEPRGPRGKRPMPSTNEQVAVLESFAHLSDKAKELLFFAPKQVGVLIIREPKTMERDRSAQRKKKANEAIDLLHPMSIPFAEAPEGAGEVSYSSLDVYKFLKRRYDSIDRGFIERAEAKAKANASARAKAAGHARGRGRKAAPDTTMRGFQSWLSHGDGASTWPFCIQPDGRPLDMCEALATDRLTEDARRLTIGEFATTLADVVSRAHIRAEKVQLTKTPRAKPAKRAAKDKAGSSSGWL